MVTILYAGILGLMYIALSLYTIAGRFKYNQNIGDGGHESMAKRIRVHGNFIEYVPLALILLMLAEFEGAAENTLHALGGALVFARLIHPIGLMRKKGPSLCRSGGMLITFGVIIVASIICIRSYYTYGM
jgi:uncharacterized membrane protein YecN with MAPEG domain